MGGGGDSSIDSVDGSDPEDRRTNGSRSDSDSDEPPEIPGSPIAQSNRCFQAKYTDPSSPLKSKPKANVMKVHEDDSARASDDDGEYEHKETEAPRAAEFNASSSSDSEDDGDRARHEATTSRTQYRPRTAAADDLHNYRDLLPQTFIDEKRRENGSDREAQLSSDSPGKQASTLVAASKSSQEMGASKKDNTNAGGKYKIHVPSDIEKLFEHVPAYKPEVEELETMFEPFPPDFIPAIGLPFDGVQVPRPDGKSDGGIGVRVLKEPLQFSNVAELELLLQSTMKSRKWAKSERIHSIEDASHRPKEITQWIESVAKVRSTKPLHQVVYSKPMPTTEAILELWPEEMEEFLSKMAPLSLLALDLDILEVIKVVCVILDIPVRDGKVLESLHLLFSAYSNITAYERQQEQQAPPKSSLR
ncbi:TPA: hypothetical protein N0F65_005547 [Lagenidium giganteum]|uniref:Intraflagellar transport protein 46 homolog n=1 Tax=Lagenidium giganteum TaxID=4803 RepID=A0AAV2YU07_9STRA|nr:TPA: hypothetical protein N0F65_005547 [Lagenidium giganteum]